MSCFGLDPDGVSAVANTVMAAAAAVSLVAVFVAYKAWRRDANDRRRAQAVNVSAVVGEAQAAAKLELVNMSAQPIYDVALEHVTEDGARKPGARYPAVGAEGRKQMWVANGVVAATVAFTDAAGVRWLRSETGQLSEVT